MRKNKTAPLHHEHHKTSSLNQPGLIVKETKAQQSARTKSALDNHFHRTALQPSATFSPRSASNQIHNPDNVR
jgi:hypothetical protein